MAGLGGARRGKAGKAWRGMARPGRAWQGRQGTDPTKGNEMATTSTSITITSAEGLTLGDLRSFVASVSGVDWVDGDTIPRIDVDYQPETGWRLLSISVSTGSEATA